MVIRNKIAYYPTLGELLKKYLPEEKIIATASIHLEKKGITISKATIGGIPTKGINPIYKMIETSNYFIIDLRNNEDTFNKKIILVFLLAGTLLLLNEDKLIALFTTILLIGFAVIFYREAFKGDSVVSLKKGWISQEVENGNVVWKIIIPSKAKINFGNYRHNEITKEEWEDTFEVSIHNRQAIS